MGVGTSAIGDCAGMDIFLGSSSNHPHKGAVDELLSEFEPAAPPQHRTAATAAPPHQTMASSSSAVHQGMPLTRPQQSSRASSAAASSISGGTPRHRYDGHSHSHTPSIGAYQAAHPKQHSPTLHHLPPIATGGGGGGYNDDDVASSVVATTHRSGGSGMTGRSGRSGGGGSSKGLGHGMPKKFATPEDEKMELLYQFHRLKRRKVQLPQEYTMASDLDEMRNDFARIKRDKALDSSIMQQRKNLMNFVTTVEFCTRFVPEKRAPWLKMSGWSAFVEGEMEDFDEIFEALHEKYNRYGDWPPELRLFSALAGSAVIFSLTSHFLPGMGAEQLLIKHPELLRQLIQSGVQNVSQAASDVPLPAPTGKMRGPTFKADVGPMEGGGQRQETVDGRE
jgi:Family of unknown function (DUF5767)